MNIRIMRGDRCRFSDLNPGDLFVWAGQEDSGALYCKGIDGFFVFRTSGGPVFDWHPVPVGLDIAIRLGHLEVTP